MPSTLVSVSAAFFLGAAYEVAAAYWARAAVARKPLEAALSAGTCGLCLVVGVGIGIREGVPAQFAYALGYAVGAWMGAK
jgi:hypothetical protein